MCRNVTAEKIQVTEATRTILNARGFITEARHDGDNPVVSKRTRHIHNYFKNNNANLVVSQLICVIL